MEHHETLNQLEPLWRRAWSEKHPDRRVALLLAAMDCVGMEKIRALPSRTRRLFPDVVCEQIDFNHRLQLVAHSTEKPAVRHRTGHIKYLLFGIDVSQAQWFQVLGYTPEDQLAHILHWGRHE